MGSKGPEISKLFQTRGHICGLPFQEEGRQVWENVVSHCGSNVLELVGLVMGLPNGSEVSTLVENV